MRPLFEQSYYELLEVPLDGTERQLERAYHIVRATYGSSSVATYSIFSEQESAAILRRIEEAYAVLSDAKLRREYDFRLHREVQRRSADSVQNEPLAQRADVPSVWKSDTLRTEGLEVDEALEPEDGNYDGGVLRRIRLELGIELEEIAATTKVSSYHLECVETNRYDELPNKVYVRGFIKEFAKCLGLDPNEVADGYMKAQAKATE